MLGKNAHPGSNAVVGGLGPEGALRTHSFHGSDAELQRATAFRKSLRKVRDWASNQRARLVLVSVSIILSIAPVVQASASPPAQQNSTASTISLKGLSTEIASQARSNGKEVGVTIINLNSGTFWSFNGNWASTAASTYKFPLLMNIAQGIAAGRYHQTDKVCGIPSDVEVGSPNYTGICLTLDQLGYLAGHNSDNTAAHMLVRYIGGGNSNTGSDVLNAYARQHGAQNSFFYWHNYTTSNDLARLWQSEAEGKAGGTTAQNWLYPKLTKTEWESGIPAGVPRNAVVTHKVGMIYGETNDAALIRYGKRAYILTIMSNGPGGYDWGLLAQISRDVWNREMG